MSKPKSDVKVLKGQEAENAVYEYLKKMNRPFGAVDVAANLKGAVPKTAAQKILLALTEKGRLTQKTYGKTTFFVVNQADLECVPADQSAALEAEHRRIEEENKLLAAELKAASAEMVRQKSTPTDLELESQIAFVNDAIASISCRLEPLRSGAPLISAEDLAQVDAEWTRWRAEWVRRRNIFTVFWQLATDVLPPQDAASLAEDLGIELDTPEHNKLERSALCLPQKPSNILKRKR